MYRGYAPDVHFLTTIREYIVEMIIFIITKLLYFLPLLNRITWQNFHKPYLHCRSIFFKTENPYKIQAQTFVFSLYYKLKYNNSTFYVINVNTDRSAN